MFVADNLLSLYIPVMCESKDCKILDEDPIISEKNLLEARKFFYNSYPNEKNNLFSVIIEKFKKNR